MSKTPDELEAEIEAQREQLAATVDQLTAKFDIKSRATTADGKPRPEALAAAGSLAAMVVVLVVWKLRRNS